MGAQLTRDESKLPLVTASRTRYTREVYGGLSAVAIWSGFAGCQHRRHRSEVLVLRSAVSTLSMNGCILKLCIVEAHTLGCFDHLIEPFFPRGF